MMIGGEIFLFLLFICNPMCILGAQEPQDVDNIQANMFLQKPDMNQAVEWAKEFGPKRNELAKFVRSFFEKKENSYYLIWMDNGTLLAHFRDNGFMLPHDDDFDFGIYFPEFEDELIDTLMKKLEAFLPIPYKIRKIKLDINNSDFHYADKLEVYDPTFGSKKLRKTNFHHVTVDLQIYTNNSKNPGFVKSHHINESHINIPISAILPIQSKYFYENDYYPGPRNRKLYLKSKYGYIGKNASNFFINVSINSSSNSGKYIPKSKSSSCGSINPLSRKCARSVPLSIQIK
jgi:hypothetical protein